MNDAAHDRDMTLPLICQQALERVLTYLQEDGVPISTETCRKALLLVEGTLAEGNGVDLPARCVERIPTHFDPVHEPIPAASPSLKRGHIGYE